MEKMMMNMMMMTCMEDMTAKMKSMQMMMDEMTKADMMGMMDKEMVMSRLQQCDEMMTMMMGMMNAVSSAK
ncbi:hypothetical protein ACFSR7_02460 [Cohnella sp. GCM10020058]|uniref:hypothetical protein n=1 Tax=Cohnella sp. GCM10020058 TaxID=3317330 RepID=UPI00362A89B7